MIFKKIIFLALVLLTLCVTPINFARAAEREDNCTIHLSLSAEPLAVKSWTEPISVTYKVWRDPSFNHYCSSEDYFTLNLGFTAPGSNYTPLFQNQPINLTTSDSFTDVKSFDFSKRGLDKQTNIVLGLSGVVRRVIGATESTTELQPSFAHVAMNSTATPLPQTNTNTGNTQTGGNGNTNGINPGLDSNKIDTNSTANFNVNLDANLGTFDPLIEPKSLPELVAKIISILFILVGIAAVIVIILAGFKMVTSSGNESELTKAKAAITWAIIGLIISILAFSIVAIVEGVIKNRL